MDRMGLPVGTPGPPSLSGPGGRGSSRTAAAAAAAAASTSNRPVRRRNRMIHSCLPCRQRKIRCSKASPSCINCLKAERDCLYISPRLDEASQLRLAEIKEKQGKLERQLERDVARSTAWRGGEGTGTGGGGGEAFLGHVVMPPQPPLQQQQQQQKQKQHNTVADEIREDYHDEDEEDRDLKLDLAPLHAALDLANDDDADSSVGDTIDLGIRVGKVRITERLGIGIRGLFPRPGISEEV
ncbi:hypothetical protein SLS62_011024 [Diatrype stigma]|uniref:Zn(2)-C6 fungal-type domain-containing protein n=1 Tax=Diatrype stigma TaxID=117547 RepID=A0AAN9YG75_9PEZI